MLAWAQLSMRTVAVCSVVLGLFARGAPLAILIVLMSISSGCAKRPMKVPGETDIEVTSVSFAAKSEPNGAPNQLAVDPATLRERLGMRAKTAILTNRYYSEFREAEDRRRIEGFWQNAGYFDVVVEPPKLDFAPDGKSVAITWIIEERERYKIGQVEVRHAPVEVDAELKALVPFKPGEHAIDLEKYRKVRHDMSDLLRHRGHGHAEVFSRAFVQRTTKTVHWVYYVDAGPKTRIGTIEVQGARKVPDERVLERIGLRPGMPFDLRVREDAERALMDSGAFNAAYLRSDAQTVFIVPGTTPDTGGEITPEQIDDEGNYIPRELPEELNVIVHVVESPTVQLRVRALAELDPNRVDTSIGARVWWRNALGPLHHVVTEGRLGYGWIWRGVSDDPSGLYGEALLRTIHVGLLGRLVDARTTTQFLDELYPGFFLRQLNVGPGLRSTAAEGLFFDLDLYFRYAVSRAFGPFSAAQRDELDLPEEDTFIGPELNAAITWDRRDNAIEALRGHLLALRSSFAPGDALATHRYLTVAPEARFFVPLSDATAIGLRGAVSWVFLPGEDGVPLGPRLFGGGAYGFRGLGRHFLSPKIGQCPPGVAVPTSVCPQEVVGGRSLMEGGIEYRWLKPLSPVGAIVFGDVGGAGAGLNPFEDGVALAAGLGARLRFWYLPMAIDVAYRILEENEPQVWDDEPLAVFFRIGEAF